MSHQQLGDLIRDFLAWALIYSVVIGIPAWIVITNVSHWLGCS